MCYENQERKGTRAFWEGGYWRLVVAIYTPCSSMVFFLVILNGKSPLVLMSGPKRNPP